MRTTLALATMVALLGCAATTDAQIVPRARAAQAVVDPTLVFEDRGQKLEIYSRLRAAAVVTGGGAVQHKLSAAAEGAPLGPLSLGVVFNHALQVQGYLTGEITFKPRAEGLPADMDTASHPGLAKLTNPNIHVVVATSPREFVALLQRLKARADLEWVEAVVVYGMAADAAAPLAPALQRGGAGASR